MCFSAEASFVVGAALIPAGGYCVTAALRKRPRFVPLAIVPLLFGIQQISEGFVWLGLERSDPVLIRSASLVFLFFALAFWPFWFPFMTAALESHPVKRRVFTVIAVVSVAWFGVLYYPIINGPETILTTRVAHHSIQYDYESLAIYSCIPKTWLRVLYFLCVAIPMAFGTESLGRIPGLVFAGSAVFAAIVYDYAFVSVWCFFAALLTVYLCWLFHQIEPRAASNRDP